MSYSNPGYWLAGHAAERAAGRPFADVLADELFAPLGMKRTTFRPLMAMTYPLAQGHEPRGGRPVVVRPAADNAATWPAGSMFTSGNDLARFVVAFLHGGTLEGKEAIPEAVVKAVAAPHAPLPGGGHYGYGLVVRSLRGVGVVEHGGARVGYGSHITIAPKEKVGIIVLANRGGAGMPKTVQKAAELLLQLGPAEKPADAQKPSPEELEKLAGVYRNGTAVLELKWADGKLTLAGGKERAVEPLGGMRFRADGGETFEVVTGRDGKTTYLVRGLRAMRKQ
jgi:CubicO group peptidase (beta-lactamase class C family)